MAEKLNNPGKAKGEKKKTSEKLMRIGRDFNIVVGSVALIGAAIAPPVAAAGLVAYAGWNYAQSGGFEVARRYVANKEKKMKQDSKNKKAKQ